MSQVRGKFITLEGVDGAGKSTHLAWLAERVRQRGVEVVVTREPGGTPLGEQLRKLVLGEPMHIETETLLMFAARREHLERVIYPSLAAGKWVISDRFTDATFAYQGGGRGFDLQVLSQLEQWVQALPTGGLRQPGLTLWFELDPAIAAQRLAQARVPDRFESQPQAFFRQVHDAYAARAQADAERFVRIAADAPMDSVRQAVLNALRERGLLTAEVI